MTRRNPFAMFAQGGGGGGGGDLEWIALRYAERDTDLDSDPLDLEPSVTDTDGEWDVSVNSVSSQQLQQGALFRFRIDPIDAGATVIFRVRATSTGPSLGAIIPSFGLVAGPSSAPVGVACGYVHRNTVPNTSRANVMRNGVPTGVGAETAPIEWADEAAGVLYATIVAAPAPASPDGGVIRAQPTSLLMTAAGQVSITLPFDLGATFDDDADLSICVGINCFSTNATGSTAKFRPEYAIVRNP